uniref:Uncharacterized protein n=1 Tax=Salvator merianae TaxID=96440 RepID=A0A8D0B5K4_SALMN
QHLLQKKGYLCLGGSGNTLLVPGKVSSGVDAALPLSKMYSPATILCLNREPSSKHFLSEDKMAARFNNLSLDNDHIYSSNGFPIHNKDPKWNPCTEVVLWSPPGNSGLQSIRTLMSMPSSLSSSAQDQQDMVAMQEEMEV